MEHTNTATHLLCCILHCSAAATHFERDDVSKHSLVTFFFSQLLFRSC